MVKQRDMKNTRKAFLWITDILENKKIPYKISGGFAARIYGSNRELADIDIDIDDSDILKIIDDVKPHIIFGPSRYTDDNWDLSLITLKYEEQEIDIAGTQAKLFNRQKKQWEPSPGNLQNIELKEVFGKNVPMEPKKMLIAYKTKLARDVDIEDIRQLENNSQKTPA